MEKLFFYFKNINQMQIIFFIIALCHYISTFYFTAPYSSSFDEHQKFVYFSAKILAFIIIVIFWQLIPFVIKAYKENNQAVISFTRYTLLYWAINLIVAYFITSPMTDYWSTDGMIKFNGYYAYSWVHILNDFIPVLNYNIVPIEEYSSAICSTFVYSLIFSYCVNGLKNQSFKYYYLLIIPLCIPVVLSYNLLNSRTIYGAWLFVFITFYIFLHQKDNSSNVIKTLIFGLLCGTLVSIRPEYTVLILIFPILLFLLKIFDAKRLLIFTIVSFLIFSSFIDSKGPKVNNSYIFHNLSYIYIKYQKSEMRKAFSFQDYQVLKKIYPLIDLAELDNSNFVNSYDIGYENRKNLPLEQINNEDFNAFIILTKLFFKNIQSIFQYNISKTINSIQFDFCEISQLKINMLDKSKDENARYFLYGTNNFHLNFILKFLYHPITAFVIFIILSVYGIKRKEKFFTCFGLTWILIDLTVFTTMPFFRFLYFFPQFLNAFVLAFVPIIETLQNKQIEKTKHLK